MDFVLVHGAWHGGWCWAEFEAAMQARGHRTHAVTLTGLGERSHLLSEDLSPDLHVLDVVNTIKWRELDQVILVGHSYGGTIISGVAGLMPDKIAGLVYLDALVPDKSNQSLFDIGHPDRLAKFQAQIDQGAIGLEPDLFEAWTSDLHKQAWLKQLCTLHPVGCMTQGVTLTGREAEIEHKLYILAERNKPSLFWAEFDKLAGQSGWTRAKIDALHDVMVEQPLALADMILGWLDDQNLELT